MSVRILRAMGIGAAIASLVSHAAAQDGGAAKFRDRLTECASSLRMPDATPTIDAIASAYDKALKGGSRILPLRDLLAAVPLDRQVQALDVYNRCAADPAGGNKDLELESVVVTSGQPFSRSADQIIANSGTIRSFLPVQRAENGANGANGENGANGANGAGGRGANGLAGSNGTDGASGRSAGAVQLAGDTLVGHLVIDNSGEAGGIGGDGGAGGTGGRGGLGSSAVTGIFDCRSGPGNGGGGGDGGAGGDAGRGGPGGNGGTVTLTLRSLAPDSSISITTLGGAGGDPGHPGPPGRGGDGGYAGSANGLCNAGGRGPGAAGAPGVPGRSSTGGRSGRDGQIQVTIGGKTQLVTGKYQFSAPVP